MVRAQTKETSTDKKETPKQKPPSKKKSVATGVWPCKINGCNKQFAREADLKRHQRTTKLHSMPGFACPQCDATFTRTDALRRHQKSRHNGVIIEPIDGDRKDGDNEESASGSKSGSRGGSPSSKGKERSTSGYHATAYIKSVIPGPAAGASSYYRQHLTTSAAFASPRGSELQYSNVGLPTSATRLNQANWSHPPPWPEGSQIGYHPIPGAAVFYASPYYRPQNASQPPLAHPTSTHNLQTVQNGQGSGRHSSLESSRTNTPTNQSSSRHSPDNARMADSTARLDKVTDPSLDTSVDLESNEGISSSLKAAEEAVVAAIVLATRGRAKQATASVSNDSGEEYSRTSGSPDDNTDENREPAITDQLAIDNKPRSLHGYETPPDRPAPMEHILTEDGEPMLNPAELLTSESLKSPSPS